MPLGLKSPLKQGDKLPITLDFKKAGKVELSLDVEGLARWAPPAATWTRNGCPPE